MGRIFKLHMSDYGSRYAGDADEFICKCGKGYLISHTWAFGVPSFVCPLTKEQTEVDIDGEDISSVLDVRTYSKEQYSGSKISLPCGCVYSVGKGFALPGCHFVDDKDCSSTYELALAKAKAL